MSNKKQGVNAAGIDASAPQTNTSLSALQIRLQAANKLQKTVRLLKSTQEHLDFLNDCTLEDETAEDLENDHSETKIVLQYGHNQKYEIKNPAILTDLRAYMLDRLSVRKQELENEILTAAL
jgi:hypothetical protein